jgi:hypothetical protein
MAELSQIDRTIIAEHPLEDSLDHYHTKQQQQQGLITRYF